MVSEGTKGTSGVRISPCDSASLRALPLVEQRGHSTTGSGSDILAVFLTGDGGWAKADDQLARGLEAQGVAVVGMNMRSYLDRRRTPDEVSSDVACIASTFMSRWQRHAWMLVGYSRGADVAPFAVARFAGDLRAKLTLVAMLSPGNAANFQFHLIDLIRDVKRDDDVPVLPELQRLRGLKLLCVSGKDDDNALCPHADTSWVRVVMRDGGHRITEDFDVIGNLLADALKPREPQR